MPLRRDDPFVGFPIVSRESRVVAIGLRDALPQLPGAFARTITDIKGDDLFGHGVNRNPDPLLVFFAGDETPHFIGLRFEPQELNDAARFTDLEVEIIRQIGIDLRDEAKQPSQADFGAATNATQTQPFKQQSLDQSFLLFADVLRVLDELAIALLAQIVLFAVASMTITFDVRQSTTWTKKIVHGGDSS